MKPASERPEAQSYPEEGAGATARLTEEVMALIVAKGSLSFPHFFELALYHPEWGYYARVNHTRTGREGDFFTAVSVGPLFGRILAEYALAQWQIQGSPISFRLVEWGAEQGDLARDIYQGVQDIGGDFAQAFQYAVVEPLCQKRQALIESLAGIAEVVSTAAALGAKPGLALANELIDALSFWLIRWEKGQWWERRVSCDESSKSLQFSLESPGQELTDRLGILADFSFPEGYETELRPSLAPFLSEMASVLSTGEVLLFDYGFERADLYHRSRTTGTLRTYGRHQAEEDPLTNVGQLDITAHVDFTALAEDAEKLGLLPQRLESQGNFLTKAAVDYLREREGEIDPHLIRQFQTLTHPAHLGVRFSVFRTQKIS